MAAGLSGAQPKTDGCSRGEQRLSFLLILARSQEHALSDVDLLVIGAVGPADLAPALRKAESRRGREVNSTRTSNAIERRKMNSMTSAHSWRAT